MIGYRFLAFTTTHSHTARLTIVDFIPGHAGPEPEPGVQRQRCRPVDQTITSCPRRLDLPSPLYPSRPRLSSIEFFKMANDSDHSVLDMQRQLEQRFIHEIGTC
ncbi:hypothetical protein Ccrd_011342 [Cynara cardunculus var. scolymus]|uniref:Uncharacterized protein n=1 Tax=Cynara cardunculus var. scolymus TaxID=59895 RepID=A0A124SHP8_CYNCS|nr:hypothetical protein Ccrd_011342 [Cynara cardunculus var. scolymus]